jgi:hypothetical protein
MAIVGHPKYAAGEDTSEGDEEFASLYAMLEIILNSFRYLSQIPILFI